MNRAINSSKLRLALLALLVCSTLTLSADETRQPNIILIMTDDQGYGDLGFTGNPVLDTPNLDELAQSSARLSRFYVSPVCSPTRASLMTGRYNYRTRVVDTFRGRSMMDPEEITLAELLNKAGYRTGIFGKWHLGDNYPMRAIDQGFDVSLLHKGGGLGQPSDPIENDRRYTDAILWKQGKAFQSEGYCTDVFFDGAMDFVDESIDSDQPFFAYIAPNAPHAPFHDVPEELYRKYRDMDLSPVLNGNAKTADNVARVFAMIENIDQNVGRLLQRLREREVENDTIVVFLVDNGPNTPRYVGPFRGMKAEVLEGGIRSPFFVRWPSRLAPGEASNQPAAHIDVLPTVLEAAGIRPPQGLNLDGRSLLPLLQRKPASWPERTLFIQYHRGEAPIEFHHFAAIEERWKLIRPSGRKEQPVQTALFELYDLHADPGEERNLAELHPDVVARLKSGYKQWFHDVSNTRPDNYASPLIVIGSAAPERTHLTRQDWKLTNPSRRDRGYWKLEATEDCSYAVEAIFTEPVSGNLELRIGSYTHSTQVRTRRSRIAIPELTFAKGPFEIECIIQNDDDQTAAYHVVLTKKS